MFQMRIGHIFWVKIFKNSVHITKSKKNGIFRYHPSFCYHISSATAHSKIDRENLTLIKLYFK